jgi:hypothetical protein
LRYSLAPLNVLGERIGYIRLRCHSDDFFDAKKFKDERFKSLQELAARDLWEVDPKATGFVKPGLAERSIEVS